ncbi:MAG TPA: carbohydrate ABC transporter permease [Clostridiaceae bacterium]|nr:carbohydrate ABC transporter permease [Clostridiaceae bacterium]
MTRRSDRIFKVISVIISLIVVILCLFPLLWMTLAGFKPEREVMAVPLKLLPSEWTLQSFDKLFNDKNNDYFQALKATLYVASLSSILVLIVNSMAAYAFARLEFTFKKLLWRIIILTMYIPGMTILISSFVLVSQMGILDTYTVLIVPGLASAYEIFFFRQFFLNMPMALEESALIDGASRFRIYLTIFLPNAKSPLVIIGIGAFLRYWNSFVWPVMTISDKSKYQVMQIIRSFRNAYSSKFGVVMAASTIAAIIPITLFLFFQKYIIRGIVLSGIK